MLNVCGGFARMQRALLIFSLGAMTGILAPLIFAAEGDFTALNQLFGTVDIGVGADDVKFLMSLFIATSLAMLLFWVYA